MNIITNIPLVGSAHCLDITAFKNWDEFIGDLSAAVKCKFWFEYNGTTFTGVLTLNDAGDKVLLAFDNECVALPSGICIDYSCSNNAAVEDVPICVNVETTTISDDTRLAVLDDNGCPAGFVTFKTLLQAIMDNFDLNDLLNITYGTLVASDKILTINSTDCGANTFKAVPQSDLKCPCPEDCP